MRKLNYLNLAAAFSISAMLLFSGCSDDDNDSTPPPATSIDYIDYKGETRTAALTAGDAEVLAGTGYEHTLFDTADNKCQHCHNRLYDTWKSSMHSKSWSDKIFQTKQQDFLRTHIAKIGVVKDVEYTTDTFTKVGKTCAKCHAPAAIYSGDYKITLTEHNNTITDLNSTEWSTLKASLEVNRADQAGYDSDISSTVASIGADGKLYTATYAIGHANNREGINCATCHSIESIRLMTDDGRGDGGGYTLASAIRGNVIGAVVYDENYTLGYSSDTSDSEMNAFFKLVGPEKYINIANSPHEIDEYDVNKSNDGRYTFRGIDVDDSANGGKKHYTGGPFYGPFGITGLGNSNEDDDTNRSAQVNPHYNAETNNHFANNGKALCLSCHQRSAGAIVPAGTSNEGEFMELCSTWTAVSNGSDTNYNDSLTSPKCQKCHMPRVDEPMMLHQWGKPTTHFTQADMHLTDHFDPDSTLPDAENPVKGKWMNDHAFVGGSKTGTSNYLAKIQSGFDATLAVDIKNGDIRVKTTLLNKTAHMFPAAHPMRRLLTRVTVTDTNGVEHDVTSATGSTDFTDIVNNIVTGNGTDTLNVTGEASVDVFYDSNRVMTYQGQSTDIDGAVTSQDFNGSTVVIVGADGTLADQFTDSNGKINGTVKNAAIVESSVASNFTRIYGRETGKIYNGAFIVRPGFDSNIVPDEHDNRLKPNEEESYDIRYTVPDDDYTVTYKVYYMQKGANGDFNPSNPKNLISEVYTATQSIPVRN